MWSPRRMRLLPSTPAEGMGLLAQAAWASRVPGQLLLEPHRHATRGGDSRVATGGGGGVVVLCGGAGAAVVLEAQQPQPSLAVELGYLDRLVRNAPTAVASSGAAAAAATSVVASSSASAADGRTMAAGELESESVAAFLRRMDQQGTVPSVGAYSCMLEACVPRRALNDAKAIHAHILKSTSGGAGGFNHDSSRNIVLGNCLVQTLVKCGGLQEALSVFEGLPRRLPSSWTAVIAGHCAARQPGLALRAYHAMRAEGSAGRPGKHALVHALKACASLGDLRATRELHRDLDEARAEGSDLVVADTALVEAYARCRSMTDARAAFDAMPQRDAVAWSTLIAGYVQAGQADEAFGVYSLMRAAGVRPDDRTFVSLLKACTAMAAAEEGVRVLLGQGQHEQQQWVDMMKPGAMQQGRLVHAQVVEEARAVSSAFIRSSLVQMYATCGSVADARLVFDLVWQEDVVVWNAMIAAYAAQTQQQQTNADEALELYLRMAESGVSPDERTFVSVLKACATLAAVERETNFADSDDGDGDGDCGNNTSSSSPQQQVRTNRHLNLKLAALHRGKRVHADVVRHGFHSNIFVTNTLVHVYATCGSIADARDVFDTLSQQRTVVTWNAMITGYANQEQGEEALRLFDQMKAQGVKPNDRTFVSVLKALNSVCASSQSPDAAAQVLEAGHKIHDHIVSSGYQADPFVGNSLVHMYASCGSLADARHVFDTLSQRGIVSWNAMIAGYAQQEESGDKALQLFEQMQLEDESGVQPNERTFVSVLKACAAMAVKERESGRERGASNSNNVGDDDGGDDHHQDDQAAAALEHTKTVHREVQRRGYDRDAFVGSALVHAYAACGRTEEARCIFDSLPKHDVVVWNTMIRAFAENEMCDEALRVYGRMKQEEEGVRPDEATFICALKACSDAGALAVCAEIHLEMVAARRLSDWSVDLSTSLIHAYGKCGSMADARQLFDSLPHTTTGAATSVALWSSLIAGYARAGDWRSCLSCFQEMQQAGSKPDSITFTSVLSACGHAGLVDEGLRYFTAMTTQFGICATLEHFITVVDLCARAGYFSQAEHLVQNMPMLPDLRLWLTLLSACRIHGQVELGRRAFERAVALDPAHCAAYGIMANIYASAHLLDEAREVEHMRAQACGGKKPGQSWIVLDDAVHKFRVADCMHLQTEEVYATLKHFTRGAHR